MTTTIRKTERYQLFQDIYGNTAVCDNYTGAQTNWNANATDVRDEINHVKHLNDEQFDEYCEMLLSRD